MSRVHRAGTNGGPWVATLAIATMALACLSHVTVSTLSAQPMPRVTTGAELLVKTNFSILAGKRVGLIVNQTATVGSAHLSDLIRSAENVTLAALFVPEHGGKGDTEAGEPIAGAFDRKTRVPTHSLY